MSTDNKVTIYHNPRCSKSRQTLQLVRDAGIEPEVIEYLKTPPTADEMDAIEIERIEEIEIEQREIVHVVEPFRMVRQAVGRMIGHQEIERVRKALEGRNPAGNAARAVQEENRFARPAAAQMDLAAPDVELALSAVSHRLNLPRFCVPSVARPRRRAARRHAAYPSFVLRRPDLRQPDIPMPATRSRRAPNRSPRGLRQG